MNYKEAGELLTGRCKKRKKLAYNTYLERGYNDCFSVHLHGKEILKLYADGTFRMNTHAYGGGVTFERLRRYVPYGFCPHMAYFKPFVFTGKADLPLANAALWNEHGRTDFNEYLNGVSFVDVFNKIHTYSVAYSLALVKGSVMVLSNLCEECESDIKKDEQLMAMHVLKHLEENTFSPSLIRRAVHCYPKEGGARIFQEHDLEHWLTLCTPEARKRRKDKLTGACKDEDFMVMRVEHELRTGMKYWLAGPNDFRGCFRQALEKYLKDVTYLNQ